MKVYRSIFIVLAVLAAVSCGRREAVENESAESSSADSSACIMGFCPDSLIVEEGHVKSGQFFSNLLGGL
jgi:hypothetical protein